MTTRSKYLPLVELDAGMQTGKPLDIVEQGTRARYLALLAYRTA